jgi:ribonuclease HI/exonuclease III
LGTVRSMSVYPTLRATARGRRLAFHEGKTIAPFVGEGHFRLILGTGSEREGTLWIFDSLGLHRQFRAATEAALKFTYPNHELVDLQHMPQNDSHACGTWVVWATQAMVEYRPEDGPFDAFFMRWASAQGVTSQPTEGNGRFIASLKQSLRDMGIQRSSAAPPAPDTSIRGGESRGQPVQLDDSDPEVVDDPQSELATPWGGREPAPESMRMEPREPPVEQATLPQDLPGTSQTGRREGRTRRQFHMVVDSEDEWEEGGESLERPQKNARLGREGEPLPRGVAVKKPAGGRQSRQQAYEDRYGDLSRSRSRSRGRSRSRSREPNGGAERTGPGETLRGMRAARRREGQRVRGERGGRGVEGEPGGRPRGDSGTTSTLEYEVGSIDVRPARKRLAPELGLSHVDTPATHRGTRRKVRRPGREEGLHKYFAPTPVAPEGTGRPGPERQADPLPLAAEDPTPLREWTADGPPQELWTLVTWNVKGLGRERDIEGDASELHALVGQCDPAVVCLQETWTKRGAKWRKPAALKNYQVFRSSTQKTAEDAPGRHKGGVLTAIASRLRPASMAESIQVEEKYQGYVLPVLLDTGESRTLIVNVYAPPVTDTTLQIGTGPDTRWGRTRLRTAVLEEVRRVMEEQSRKWPGLVTIVGGDVNATMVTADRGTEYKTDRDYRQWAQEAGLTTCGPLEGRPHTFYPSEERRAAGVRSGRIDDWLISEGAVRVEPQSMPGAGVVHIEHRSDHEPLAVGIRPVGYAPPGSPPRQAPIRRIVAPFTPEHKSNLLEALEDSSHDGVCELQRLVSNLREETNGASRDGDTSMEAITTKLAEVLGEALEKTMDTVGENVVAGEGTKARPEQRGHMNTTLKAKHEGARAKRNRAEAALRQLRRTSQDSLDAGAHPQALTEYYMRYPSLREEVGERDSVQRDTWMEALTKEIAKARAEMRALATQHDRARARKQHTRAEHDLRYNAKKVHRDIFGSSDNKKTLTAVRTRDGRLDTTAEAVLEATAAHFEGTSVRRVDDSACDRAPWERGRDDEVQRTTDHIQLPSARDKVAGDFMIGHLYNRGIYDQALASLPGKKAPGIDGVPNEVLKHMPAAFHDAMHGLFKILWEQHRTPTAWKQALTVLLYKKDDPHEVKNYRPIGLLTAVYKLWSAVVTRCLSAFVEEHEMLSGAQEGFRANRNTVRQLQRLTMMMEDSKLSNEPLYVLYVDFVNAFGSIDHKLLTNTMARQHYPQDIIDIIEDLYCESVMRVRTPLGVTREIRNLGRGTVQGDPLSPLLFIIAIDPLLRWLQAGNRGYRMHTSKTEIAALAYADDLAVTASSVAHLRDQARKIEEFCVWAGLEVNVDQQRKNKTAWTGPAQTAHRDGALVLLGLKVPRLTHSEPYIYLGLHVSLNLKWRKHAAALIRKVQQKLEAISRMTHSPELVMRTLESVVRPTIRYTMPVGVMGWGTIGKLNSRFTTAAKNVVGLSRHSSNWTVMRDRLQAGLGVDPLHLTYMTATLSEVQELQTSTEDLGDMWRGLWAAHQARMAPGGRVPHFEGYREAYPVRNVMAQMQDLGITLGPEQPTEQQEGTDTLYGLARILKEAGVKNTSCIKPLLEAGVRLTQEIQRAGDGRVMNLHDLRRSDTDFSRAGPNQGRALRQLAELLHKHPEITLPTPKKGPLEGWEGWGGTAGPTPELPGTGTAHTVTVGRPGKKRFAQSGGQDIRPAHTIPLRQASEEGEALLVAEIRAKEYRAGYGDEEEGGASGGWHYEVRFEGRDDWEWVRGSNMDSDPRQRDEDIKLYRLSRRPPPPAAGQTLAPLHGYRVAVLLHPSMPDITEDMECGKCGSAADARGNDILQCDGCGCAVHQLCHTPPVTAVPAGGWVCCECDARGIIPTPEPPRKWGTLQTTSKADEVEYDPGTYPYVILFDDDTLDSIYTNGVSKHRVRGQEADDAKGAFVQNEMEIHPPSHAGTGEESTNTDRDREIQQALQRKLEAGELHMATEPADPYRDIKPTGDYTIRRSQGAVPCMEGRYRTRRGNRTQQASGVPGAAVVHSYAPDGTWLGVMTEARYEFLERKWKEYWADPRRRERGGGDIQWRPLAREIADLFKRYRPGAKKGDGSKVNLQNHWAVRDPLRRAIMRGYKVTHECFASPLNCLIGEDAPEWYCSAHRRDVVFGAKYDAYAQWPGGESMYMNPEYTKEDIKRALKWAVAASQLEDPFSAVLVIPRFLMAPYMDLLSHHNVRLIAKAERDTFSFMAPTHWEVGDRDPEGKNTAKWQVMVVEVANWEGREWHKAPDAEVDIQGEICRAGAQIVTRADPAFTDAETPYTVPAPKEMTQLRRKTRRAARWPEPAEPPIQCETQALHDMRPEELAARDPKAGRIIFTDGSKMQDEVGAGYVIPVRPWHVDHFESTDDLLFPGRKMKVAGPQTVNRAEMTAILAALQDVGDGTDCSIYTDSKVSIQNVKRWAADPNLLNRDKHEDILRDIAHRLATRTGHTRILKIMAHKGHPGNEAADRKAKQATEQPEGTHNQRRGTYESGRESARTLYMEGESLTDLKKQLRPKMQRWAAEQNGLLTATHLQWTCADEEKGTDPSDVDPKPSNVHWRKGKPKPKSIIKQVFRMRGNDYVCNHMKWLHAPEAKKSETSKHCPYRCRHGTTGELLPDTWIHTFLCRGSGAADMATARHNAACRIIERAIKKGDKARATLLRNYGRQDEAPEEETVPAWLLPPEHRGTEALADSPDFMIVEGLGRHEPRPLGPLPHQFYHGDQQISYKLTIGEVKYTHDLKMPLAHMKAQSKYQGDPHKLADKLRTAGWKVTGVYTIVIGHRACVSAQNKMAFEGLGIKGKKAQAELQEKLAESAAEWARTIVGHTRKARAKLSVRSDPNTNRARHH